MPIASQFVIGSAALFIMGGCNSFLASELFPTYVRNTRLLASAQLQYFFVGFGLFCGWAALYYWLAKTSRVVSEERGQWSFWLMFVGFNLAFFPSLLRNGGVPPLPSEVFRLFVGNASVEACMGGYILAAGFFLSISNVALALIERRHN